MHVFCIHAVYYTLPLLTMPSLLVTLTPAVIYGLHQPETDYHPLGGHVGGLSCVAELVGLLLQEM